jgi:hypothetical protein
VFQIASEALVGRRLSVGPNQEIFREEGALSNEGREYRNSIQVTVAER